MTALLATRIDIKLANLVKEICEVRGEDVSSFLRRAILTELARLSYLTPAEKKALGVHPISRHSPEEA